MFILLMVDAINVIMLNIWKVGTSSVKTVCDLSVSLLLLAHFHERR